MDEFSLIARYFRPLAAGLPGSLNLSDDAALLSVPGGQALAVTKDALVQGVHFLGSEKPELIARKLLRVNLSDLAAMGAKPFAYFLALMLPKDTSEEWLAGFALGLAEDQLQFGLYLAGGDTTATPGPLSLSLTALGTVRHETALKRSGARAGDVLYVSGTLGDAALGLASLQKKLPGLSAEDRAFLEDRYLLPQPRLSLGENLRGLATACMDVSDGLAQDAGHLCAASGCAARIESALLPLSDAARRACGNDITLPLTGGDDYELLFTAPPHLEVPAGCARIGMMEEGGGVVVVDAEGRDITPQRGGWKHFS